VRTRSTTPSTTIVTIASTTEAASAIPKFCSPGREISW
jgi:hypothetical protein